MYAARLSCGHASLVNLDSLNNLNIKLERERQEKLRKSLGKGRYEEEKKKKKASGTRAEVFHEAISKARPSATVSSYIYIMTHLVYDLCMIYWCSFFAYDSHIHISPLFTLIMA